MRGGWNPQEELDLPRFGAIGAVRFVLRVVPMAVVTFGGLAMLLVVRLGERPVFGQRRPVTPWITQGVCRTNMAILGIQHEVQGQPMRDRGAMVSNHVSWLDIFSLNALDRIYFVAKHEVAGWFGIGWLARATGTVFVERRARAAKEQEAQFHQRLSYGHRLLFFPEGTSTDGKRVLEFKSTLFSAFFNELHREDAHIQPITQIYRAPAGLDERFFGWWGEAEFGPHFLSVMSAPRGGRVKVLFHKPLRVAEFDDRKTLTRRAHEIVREGFETGQPIASA